MDRVRKFIHAEEKDIGPWNGEGITAAILDSGIVMHPDLKDQVVGFRDFLNGYRLPYDDCGHGTHVAGILAGNGRCSGGRYRGIAPGCRIVTAKVLDQNGEGTISDMIRGLDWILNKKDLYEIRALNISVSMNKVDKKEEIRTLLHLLEEVWKEGIFVTAAAGNHESVSKSLSVLGNSSGVITVGSYEESERYLREKPDILAPGDEVYSCSSDFRITSGKCRNSYVAKRGTSMATPMVTGTAVLCMQKFKWYDNEQVRKKIFWAARDFGINKNEQQCGLLHVGRTLL